LIGTIRRECLDRSLFWTALDLESKLSDFRAYYNEHRTHSALKGQTPIENPKSTGAELKHYCWKNIVTGYTKRLSRHEQEFATDRPVISPSRNRNMPCHINRRSLAFMFFSQRSEDHVVFT